MNRAIHPIRIVFSAIRVIIGIRKRRRCIYTPISKEKEYFYEKNRQFVLRSNHAAQRDGCERYYIRIGGNLTDMQKAAADMNSDGEVDMRDAFALYALVSGG